MLLKTITGIRRSALGEGAGKVKSGDLPAPRPVADRLMGFRTEPPLLYDTYMSPTIHPERLGVDWRWDSTGIRFLQLSSLRRSQGDQIGILAM